MRGEFTERCEVETVEFFQCEGMAVWQRLGWGKRRGVDVNGRQKHQKL